MSTKPSFMSLENNKALQMIFSILIMFATVFLLTKTFEPLQIFAKTAINALSFEYGLDYGEGPLLDQAVRLSKFENIYRLDISQPPYTITNYTPIYPLLQVPFVWIFGPQLWYGRLISEISILATAIFIGLITYRLTRNPIAALISGFTFLTFPYIVQWGVVARVDSLALAFGVGGLYFLTIDPEQRKYRIWSAIFIVLAVYTKQSYGLAAPFAAFIYLLKETPRKKAFEYAGTVAILGFTIMGILMLISKGGFFFHIFRANVNPFWWETVRYYKDEMMTHFPLFFYLAGLYLLGGVWKGIRQEAWWLVAPYVLGGIAIAVTVGKEGSYINYFYELCTAISLMTGAWIGIVSTNRNFLWVQLVIIAVFSIPITGMLDYTLQNFSQNHNYRMMKEPSLKQIKSSIENVEGNVLADEFMDMVVTTGKPLQFQPFEYKMLETAGEWDQDLFVNSIKNKEYDMILLYNPPYWDSPNARWTSEQLGAIRTHYQLKKLSADTLVYYPTP